MDTKKLNKEKINVVVIYVLIVVASTLSFITLNHVIHNYITLWLIIFSVSGISTSTYYIYNILMNLSKHFNKSFVLAFRPKDENTINYLLFCFVAWITSFSLPYFVLTYIMPNNLLADILLLNMWSVVPVSFLIAIKVIVEDSVRVIYSQV